MASQAMITTTGSEDTSAGHSDLKSRRMETPRFLTRQLHGLGKVVGSHLELTPKVAHALLQGQDAVLVRGQPVDDHRDRTACRPVENEADQRRKNPREGLVESVERREQSVDQTAQRAGP